MRIQINVTKEILEKSKMCGLTNETRVVSKNCAISNAVRDIFPDAQVDGIEIDVWMENRIECSIPIPEEASLFIDNFDSYTPEERVVMNPMSFEIDIPDSIIEKIGLSEVERILSESKTLQKA